MISKDFFGTDRVAAGIALGAILLLLVFFYALEQSVTSLGKDITELRNLNGAVLDLNNRNVVLDNKVTELNALPRRTTVMTVENEVNAMAFATDDLDRRLHGKHHDKLQVIRSLLQEIGEDLHDSK